MLFGWAMVILGAVLLCVGSLRVAAQLRREPAYVPPDPLGCRDCGTRCVLNMWHRCRECTALLAIKHPKHPEAVDWVYLRGLRS